MGASSAGGDSGRGGGGYAISGKSAGRREPNKRKAAASVAGQIRRTQYETADKFQSRVDDPNDMQAQMMMAAGGSEYQRVGDASYARNLQLADELDVRNQKVKPLPGAVGTFLSGMGAMSRANQAKQLRAGGTPVFGDLGGNQVKNRSVLVGVVSRGFIPGTEVYSGRSEFNPLIREDSGFDLSSRSYGTQRAGIRSSRDKGVKLKQGFGDTGSDGDIQASNPDGNVSGTVEVASTATASGPTGAQRALGLLDTSGGQKSRYFMGKTTLS